ncbi:HAD family hydrolase [Candidatus Parvarchaeota archaeon]|nr:HAD family hydrolase [Candidatus Parvarchaeota archaeon]
MNGKQSRTKTNGKQSSAKNITNQPKAGHKPALAKRTTAVSRIRFVLVDIDDTLFPSTEFSTLARKNAVRAMIESGLEAGASQAYAALTKIVRIRGSNYGRHFDDLCATFKCSNKSKVIAAGIAAYHNTKSSILPYPQVPMTLLALRESGYQIYAASNGDAIKQWDKLIRLGIHNFFHGAFFSGDLGGEKSRRFFRRVLSGLKAGPGQVVMVGDKPEADIEPASKLGITTIRIMQGKHRSKKSNAIHTVGSFDNILEILKVY